MKRIITSVLLLTFCALSAMAQSLTVSGTVKDAGGEPLVGVVVAELPAWATPASGSLPQNTSTLSLRKALNSFPRLS